MVALLWATAGTAKAQKAAGDAQAEILPQGLRCESLVEPLGVQSWHPNFSWVLQARDAKARGLSQTAYRVLVASSRELLAQDVGDFWDSGKVLSNQFLHVPYAGKALKPHETYFWKVQVWDQDDKVSHWSGPSTWTTGLQAADWKAHWIAANSDEAWRDSKRNNGAPLPIFRRELRLKASPARAIVYVSGLGQYELHINGRVVSRDVLNPGWTNYRKTVLYNAYDVAGLLHGGANTIAMMLGNGMYNMPKTPGRYQKFEGSFGQPKLILQMHVSYRDGSQETVVSDKSWKCTGGPITFSSTYGGEDYDARRELAGWDKPGAADGTWDAAMEVDGPGGQLEGQLIPPIRVMKTYKPVRVTQPEPGVVVEDLGQNFSGWPLITVSGPAASSVKLIPGELLDNHGLVTQRSSGQPQYFLYTLKGRGRETWHPRFSYYGFRYVQVEVSPPASSSERPKLLALAGQFTHSSAAQVGEFSTSDELLNRIHSLIDMAILSNMQSVLTDCPHREKLGWLEQTHLMGAAIFANYDVLNLYKKMANDMRDSQLPDGLVPAIAPEYVVFDHPTTDFRDSPEWGSASVISPWIAFQHSGDLAFLASHYEVMRKYVDYLGSKAHDHLLSYGLGDWYDMGPGPPGYSQLTSKTVTATAIYYEDLTILAKVAFLLDKTEDARGYGDLGRSVKDSFNAALFHADTNQYDSGSQTADAMPLALGMVPEERRAAVLENLVADVRRHGNHTTAGDIGYHFVLEALRQGGRSDVIYDMLSRTDSPSYGYQLAKGATSLTEAWDTNPKSSQNHFMLGHGEDWFYRGLAGLRVDLSLPAPNQVTIEPEIVGDIASAGASYESVLGEISTKWHRAGDTVTLEIAIPAGASATIKVPFGNPASITEGGGPASHAPAVKFVGEQNSQSLFEVGSGAYKFAWPLHAAGR